MENYYLKWDKDDNIHNLDLYKEPFAEGVEYSSHKFQYDFKDININVMSGAWLDKKNYYCAADIFKNLLESWGSYRGYYGRSLILLLSNFYEVKTKGIDTIKTMNNNCWNDHYNHTIKHSQMEIPEFIGCCDHFKMVKIKDYFGFDLADYYESLNIKRFSDIQNLHTNKLANFEVLFNLVFAPNSKYTNTRINMNWYKWDLTERQINNRLAQMHDHLSDKNYLIDIAIRRFKNVIKNSYGR